jgi:hypothetical protein
LRFHSIIKLDDVEHAEMPAWRVHASKYALRGKLRLQQSTYLLVIELPMHPTVSHR